MPPIRILIAELPPILRDIVLDTLAREPGIEVVGVLEHGACIAREVERTRATALIVGAGSHLAASRHALPGPGSGVIALTTNGREASVHVALGEISPRRFVHTIRQLPTIRFDD